ncbi:hypothetical protein [Christiangramia aestuarii]|uniref:Uncharacterized protein n=1 Tax=Christiangramia aestuarii TaxID=1028746 RepID=A0A7K1LSV4_9FLAO|nr:hypothetical protein [Christiangramia aestuarii]MUP43899.1 hypothetical protein [Christiangramia aestuarii]
MHYFKVIQKILMIIILLIIQQSCDDKANAAESKLLKISESQNLIIEKNKNLEVEIHESTIPIKELKEFASVISLVAFNEIIMNENSFDHDGYVNLIFLKNQNKIFEYRINFTDLIRIEKDITILEELFSSTLKSEISDIENDVLDKVLKTEFIDDFDTFKVQSLDVYKFLIMEDKEMLFTFLDSKDRTLKTMVELKNYQIKNYKVLDTISKNKN